MEKNTYLALSGLKYKIYKHFKNLPLFWHIHFEKNTNVPCNLVEHVFEYVLVLKFSATFRHFFSLMKGFEAVPAKLPLSVTAIDRSLIKTSTTTMQISKWRENSTRILGPGKKQNFRKLDCSNLIK